MQKIYLLLRNKEEKGPFNLEELLQNSLKPDDLIFIKGTSGGWMYPIEIEALHPFIPHILEPEIQQVSSETNTPAVIKKNKRKIYVSLPGSGCNQVEAEIIAPIQTAPRQQRKEASRNTGKRKHLRSPVFDVYPDEEKETDLVADEFNSGATLNKKDLIIAGIAIAIAIAGYFAVFQNSGNEGPVIKPQAKSTYGVVEKKFSYSPSEPIQEEPVPSYSVFEGPEPLTQKKVRSQKRSVPRYKPEVAAVYVQPQRQSSIPEKQEKYTAPPPEPIEEESSKKGLLSKIFGKKKNSKAQTAPAVDQTNNTENTFLLDITNKVSIKLYEPRNYSALGVKDITLKLTNKSSLTLKTAHVVIRYMSQTNQLMQKKILDFSAISSRGSKTLSIPDHPTANHIDVEVVSASGF